MHSLDRKDGKGKVDQYTKSGVEQQKSDEEEQSKGVSPDGRLVEGTENKGILTSEEQVDALAAERSTTGRGVAVVKGDKPQAIDTFIEKITDISTGRIDVDIKNILDSIKDKSVVLFSFALAVAVIATFSLILWPAAVVLSAFLVAGIGILMKNLVASHINTKQAYLDQDKTNTKKLE